MPPLMIDAADVDEAVELLELCLVEALAADAPHQGPPLDGGPAPRVPASMRVS